MRFTLRSPSSSLMASSQDRLRPHFLRGLHAPFTLCIPELAIEPGDVLRSFLFFIFSASSILRLRAGRANDAPSPDAPPPFDPFQWAPSRHRCLSVPGARLLALNDPPAYPLRPATKRPRRHRQHRPLRPLYTGPCSRRADRPTLPLPTPNGHGVIATNDYFEPPTLTTPATPLNVYALSTRPTYRHGHRPRLHPHIFMG